MELCNSFFEDHGYTCNHPDRVLRTYRMSGPTWRICAEPVYALGTVVYTLDITTYQEDGLTVDKHLVLEHSRTSEELENCIKTLGINEKD